MNVEFFSAFTVLKKLNRFDFLLEILVCEYTFTYQFGFLLHGGHGRVIKSAGLCKFCYIKLADFNAPSRCLLKLQPPSFAYCCLLSTDLWCDRGRNKFRYFMRSRLCCCCFALLFYTIFSHFFSLLLIAKLQLILFIKEKNTLFLFCISLFVIKAFFHSFWYKSIYCIDSAAHSVQTTTTTNIEHLQWL